RTVRGATAGPGWPDLRRRLRRHRAGDPRHARPAHRRGQVVVSAVASGDVKPYVGPSDICMMYSVTDVAGINRISERVLANAAHALAGMIAYRRASDGDSSVKPAVGLTQFGVTTT